MKTSTRRLLGVVAALTLSVVPTVAETPQELADQVRATEKAFAASMAERDLDAFASYIAEEAVFLGPGSVLRGREAVVAGWRAFFEGPQAPFAWEPERVEVLDSGTLALSTGPVHDPEGRRMGTFHSTWRREDDGSWKIVLDSGSPPCDCPDTEGKDDDQAGE